MDTKIEIKEMERKHEDIVKHLSDEGIWKSTTRRAIWSLCKSKTVISVQILLFVILHLYFENTLILILFMILLNPCALLIAGYCALRKVSYHDDPTTLDMRTNIYQYWTRPNIQQMKLFVAEIDKKVVGCIAIRPSNIIGLPTDPTVKSLTPNTYIATLERMCVHSSYRGKGIATRLIQHVKLFCKEQGFHEINLTTSGYQPDAVCLYKKCGFEIIDVTSILWVPVYNFAINL